MEHFLPRGGTAARPGLAVVTKSQARQGLPQGITQPPHSPLIYQPVGTTLQLMVRQGERNPLTILLGQKPHLIIVQVFLGRASQCQVMVARIACWHRCPKEWQKEDPTGTRGYPEGEDQLGAEWIRFLYRDDLLYRRWSPKGTDSGYARGCEQLVLP